MNILEVNASARARRAELEGKRDRIRRDLEAIDRAASDRSLDAGESERFENLSRGLESVDHELRELSAEQERALEEYVRSSSQEFERAVPEPLVDRGGADEAPAHVRRARDEGLRTIERHKAILSAEAGDRLDDVLRRRDPNGVGARYLAAVGDPNYNSAFGKMLMDPMTGHLRFSAAEVEAVRRVSAVESERALSLTGSAGGFAVPFELDPSILLTSAGAINPIREIARTETIAVDEWRGVSSAGVTAAFAAEATETTDNAPTLAQPTISTEKAQAFVPFSIEVGMDWTSLQAELARLFADSKNTLESAKFLSGTGTNEPFGVLTGTTNTVNAGAGQTFTAANLYALLEALPARFRPRGALVAGLNAINRIAQFETAAGARLFPEISDGRVLTKPIYEASDMPVLATSNKFLLFGDFSMFLIVDRIGLTIELIPHLVGTNHRPTGQRGLYAFWRVGSKVLDAAAFRALLGVA